jgi:hypothetical protein
MASAASRRCLSRAIAACGSSTKLRGLRTARERRVWRRSPSSVTMKPWRKVKPVLGRTLSTWRRACWPGQVPRRRDWSDLRSRRAPAASGASAASPQRWMPSSPDKRVRPRLSAPMTLVEIPEECQSIPITVPYDCSQKGCAHQRSNSYGHPRERSITELCHASAQPSWHAATVKQQVGTAGTAHYQPMPAGVTPGVIAAAASNNGSSSAALIGTCAKFETVTPSSRTPLAVGSSVRRPPRPAWRRDPPPRVARESPGYRADRPTRRTRPCRHG